MHVNILYLLFQMKAQATDKQTTFLVKKPEGKIIVLKVYEF